MFSDVEFDDVEMDDSSSEEIMSAEEGSDGDVVYFDYKDAPMDDHSIMGMTFTSTKEAHIFYNVYGKQMGFETRIGHKESDRKKGIVKNMKWECTLSGFRRQPNGGTKVLRKSKPDNRCGCKACFRIALQKNGMYKVTTFESVHNHKLGMAKPAKKVKRYISSGNQALIYTLSEAGIKMSKIMDVLKLAEGPSNLPFTIKDAQNFLDKERRKFVEHGDATTALYLLDGMKTNDKDFFYDHTVSEDGSVNKLFWTDGFGRAQYKLFGEALVFDSTYQTNKYNFSLVILAGVDNNMKTCVFGGALMKNETYESYAWLLRKFLEAMGGRAPLTVVTDQDAAMRKAIKDVFGETTKHRICNWHLGRNCRKNVRVSAFCNEFEKLTKENLSIDEFESAWKRITEAHGVAENPWVLETYSIKEMWAEAFFRGHFTALMRSNQRSESMNARFKERGKKGYNFCEVLKHFFEDLHSLRVASEESQTESEIPVVGTKRIAFGSFVDQASAVYSKAIRKKVLEEIEKEQTLFLLEQSNLGPGVYKFIFSTFGSLEVQTWSVEINVVHETYNCECKMLETMGFPCCHLFSAFKPLGIQKIPAACIRERWTTAIGRQLHVHLSNLFSANDPQRQRYMQLHRDSVNVCLDASQSELGTKDLLKHIQKAKESLKDNAFGNSGIPKMDETIGEWIKVRDPIRQSKSYGVGNPTNANPRGARRNRKQKCGFCNILGHKKTGCPDNPANNSKFECLKKSHINDGDEDPFDDEFPTSIL